MIRLRYLFVLGAIFIAAIALARPVYAARGYTARPCGFDLDDDGIVGEPQDDCQICNGVTKDPDHDGVDEDQIYVDCDSGSNTASCGSPSNPCRSIGYAWGSVADGPGDGAEDIICFRGTCTADYEIEPGVSGVPGGRTKAASGSDARSFEYPSNPTMLVGWDYDHDGEYPPFDTDDVAVIDGSVNSGHVAFQHVHGPSYVEYAHFTAKDFGRYTSTNGTYGFMAFGQSYGPVGTSRDIYVHDLSLSGINENKENWNSHIVFSFFRGATRLHNIAIENVEARDVGGYFARGAGPASCDGEDDGPYRFKNFTVTAHGCSASGSNVCGNTALAAFEGVKLWGCVSGVEITDSILDMNVKAWTPIPFGPAVYPSRGVFADECSRDWTIRNNMFIDFKGTLVVQPTSNVCSSRSINNVVFDRNLVWNSYEPWAYGDYGLQIAPGASETATAENVVISNNFIGSSTGWEACMDLNPGHGGNCPGDSPGAVEVINNTCWGDINRDAAIVIGNSAGAEASCRQNDLIIKNNVVAGIGSGDVNINTQYVPTNLQSDNNVWDPDGTFSWNNPCANCSTSANLGGWRSQTGTDAASKACNPVFVAPGQGDLHLAASDGCARNAGVDMSSVTGWDIDGGTRPEPGGTRWDIGADEQNSGSGGGPGPGPGPGVTTTTLQQPEPGVTTTTVSQPEPPVTTTTVPLPARPQAPRLIEVQPVQQ